ncbi:WD repeat protein [Aspergillus ruber CBS 135680]|uniref:WD domain protein n=1 Tax=Aspergillus ruber (strain CBS 135680) TaxID=1388766 RepID=A0A017SR67_ASPRC|nr:WD domain protein [Aspergillus ruber CBS 135680]EYE99034.1 WD domain protein [Aspergillus ruber CBS 135680]
MHTLNAAASSSLSLPAENYIYTITAASPGSTFAAISSDDSLRVFDAANIRRVSVIAPTTHADGVTALEPYGQRQGQQLLVTGGRDGKAKVWDLRSGKGNAVVEMETDKPVLSVACNAGINTVVAGTELASHQATVAFWDIRSPGVPRLQYVESHNDDVTELQFHPTHNNLFLSGSTDGLVNVYDTTIADEDDALVQVINHGSVHHAGFLNERAIYALSHDEVFSVHPATNPDEQAQDPEPVQFGDVREPLGCEYVAQLCMGNQGQPHLAVGNKAENRLDLVPLTSDPWHFDQNNLWRLPGAHGEEVVRSVYLDEQTQTVFTGGEDGLVRAWKPTDGQEAQGSGSSIKPSRPKEKAKTKDRFKPY